MKMKMKHHLLIIFFLFQAVFHGLSMAGNESYRIGPRDVIVLTIYAGGEKQQEVHQSVTDRGMINVPFIGPVRAGGLITSELETKIAESLGREFFVNPEVHLYIKEYHSLRYYISGAVKEPGLYELTSETTLMRLIAKAGGVLPNRGHTAYILSDSADKAVSEKNDETFISGRSRTTVDLKELLDKGNMAHDLPLQTGDMVYIPPEKTLDLAESKFYVEGEVKNPGVFDYRIGTTALSACITAGGFDELAAPDQARIIRKQKGHQKVIKIDLDKVKKGQLPDIELKPGDLLHVPEQEAKIYVEGEVKQPGVFDYRPGMTALSVCIMAGGFDKFAAPKRTRIIRQANGRQEIIEIDLDKVKKGQIPDIELKPEDRIHVPETWL